MLHLCYYESSNYLEQKNFPHQDMKEITYLSDILQLVGLAFIDFL